MDWRVVRQRTADLRRDIQGKIISYLHIPSGSDIWRFCGFISSHICKGYNFLNARKEWILALFFFVLEAISVVLDQIGKDKKAYLLAAFLLSVFGLVINLDSCIKAITNRTVVAETQLKVVEIVFSLIQSIIALVQYLLTVLKVKNDYNACAFPLAFAMIAIVFTFIKDGQSNDSSPEDWPPANSQPVDFMNRTHIEPDQIGSSSNQVEIAIFSAEPLPNFQAVGSATSSPIKLDQIGSSGSQVDGVTSIVKRSANVGDKRAMFELQLIDDEAKEKAREIVTGVSGVDLISMEFKNNILTMKGKFDPIDIAIELRTICQTQLVSVEPIKAAEKRPAEKKEEAMYGGRPYPYNYSAYQAYDPYYNPYYRLKTE